MWWCWSSNFIQMLFVFEVVLISLKSDWDFTVGYIVLDQYELELSVTVTLRGQPLWMKLPEKVLLLLSVRWYCCTGFNCLLMWMRMQLIWACGNWVWCGRTALLLQFQFWVILPPVIKLVVDNILYGLRHSLEIRRNIIAVHAYSIRWQSYRSKR